MADTTNKCFLSIASIWEIAIKSSLNRIDLHGDFNRIAQFINANDIELLPLTFEHIQKLLSLDFHHRDPFDRIIIAQAFSEKLTIATNDNIFHKYGVDIVWK
ncbi:MAG: type II toxin-antitoxin system VapC family toxin [Chitinophagaceae bacterium]